MTKTTRFTGIYSLQLGKKDYYATKNLLPGIAVAGERLATEDVEYRILDPLITKLGAAFRKGLQQFPLKPTDTLLYLGASSGTTVSYFSDILGKTGTIFALEIARRPCMDLVLLAEQRKNIIPLLADAAQPQEYADKICVPDLIYQDVSQRNQVDIFLKNCAFLKKDGFAILCLKARSIDAIKEPAKIYEEALKKISEHLEVIDKRELDPFQKDHLFIVCKKK